MLGNKSCAITLDVKRVKSYLLIDVFWSFRDWSLEGERGWFNENLRDEPSNERELIFDSQRSSRWIYNSFA
jgi:hypothetical protein